MFARRGYNVQSLAVGNSEREGMSRITMVVPASTSGISKLIKQLNKLVYVEKVGRRGVGEVWGERVCAWFLRIRADIVKWWHEAARAGHGISYAADSVFKEGRAACRSAALAQQHVHPRARPPLLPAQVEELTLTPHVSRELMLVKVNCTAQQRGELVSLASVRGARGWRTAVRLWSQRALCGCCSVQLPACVV